MPYRGPLETVFRRCAELHRRVELFERKRTEPPPCRDLAGGLAWEAELQSRLASLQADDPSGDDRDELGGVAQAIELGATAQSLRRPSIVVYALIGAFVGIAVIAAFAAGHHLVTLR